MAFCRKREKASLELPSSSYLFLNMIRLSLGQSRLELVSAGHMNLFSGRIYRFEKKSGLLLDHFLTLKIEHSEHYQTLQR